VFIQEKEPCIEFTQENSIENSVQDLSMTWKSSISSLYPHPKCRGTSVRKKNVTTLSKIGRWHSKLLTSGQSIPWITRRWTSFNCTFIYQRRSLDQAFRPFKLAMCKSFSSHCLRFFPREEFNCPCGFYPIKTRCHILHDCKRFNKYWNLMRDTLSQLVAFLEFNPGAFSFHEGIT